MERITITKKELTVPNIDQFYYDVRRNNKVDVLTRLLDYHNPKLSLVFCNTKRMVDELASELQGRGYAAEGIHGDMKQQQRDRVMKSFRNGRTDILIATDVAARGIDVDDVGAVFTPMGGPDVPEEPDAPLILSKARKSTSLRKSSVTAKQRLKRSRFLPRMMWPQSRQKRLWMKSA